jgi:hypothetical protein
MDDVQSQLKPKLITTSYSYGSLIVATVIAAPSLYRGNYNVFLAMNIGVTTDQFFMVRSDGIDLEIPSLPSYKLTMPIHIHIECISDKEYLAESKDLNISITGSNIGETLVILKEHIEDMYIRYKSKEKLGPGPNRQLQILEKYIGSRK